MGTYAYYNITVTGPNNILLDLKTNVFESEDHELCLTSADDEIVIDGDTLTTNTYWKLRDRDDEFNGLIADHPELTVAISGYCNDGVMFSWEETFSAEDGHIYNEVELSLRHSITFECEHDGVLLYNLDHSLAKIKAIDADAVVEENVIHFTSNETFSVLDELDFIVAADVYYHYEIVGGSDAAIGREDDDSFEFSYDNCAEAM